MEFRLEADGIRMVCYSPVWTQRLISWGARLIDPSQAEELRIALQAGDVTSRPTLGSPEGPQTDVIAGTATCH